MSKGRKKGNNFMLPGMEAFEPSMGLNIDNDPSLEDELMAILGEQPTKQVKKSTSSKDPPQLHSNILDMNVDDNEEVAFDENDPELLAELEGVLDSQTPQSTPDQSPKKSVNTDDLKNKLNELQNNYQVALNNAKMANEVSKVKRYDRSLKIIYELISKVNKGLSVDEADFPPPVPVKPVSNYVPQTQEVQHLNPINSVQSDGNKTLEALLQRQEEYKNAALTAKNSNIELAKGLMIVYKQFNEVINAVKLGESFDIADMPPHPSKFKLSDLAESPQDIPEEPKESKVNHIMSIDEELKSRLEFFQNSLSKAKSEQNSSKIRRMTRIVNQYQEAIVAQQKNIPFNLTELPPPPGKDVLSAANNKSGTTVNQAKSSTTITSALSGPGKPQNTFNNKTISILQDKNKQFRKAALEAKKSGDIELAKELLKQSMGIEKMQKAAEGGLPVNLSQIPTLPTEFNPQLEMILPTAETCDIPEDMNVLVGQKDKSGMFQKLAQALNEQVTMCQRYQSEMRRAGDVLASKRFEELAKHSKQDLDGLKCLIVKGSDIPKFHYEYKLFTLAQINPELSETELFVEIIRATDLSIPQGYTADQLDTYVVVEFPFPNDNFQTFTSETIKKTNNPEYKSTHKFEINLKSRVVLRVIRHKAMKMEIYYRRGFLQKDKLLGTATIKMTDLEKNCTIYNSYDLYDGRKLIGGKLEARLLIRHPISSDLNSNHRQVKEKWLVIDDFNKNADKVEAMEQLANAVKSSQDDNLGSVEVLKYEIGEMKKALEKTGNSSAAAAAAANVRKRLREKEANLAMQLKRVNSTDQVIKSAYTQYLNKLMLDYAEGAKKQLAAGNREKAQAQLIKKSLVEKELASR